MHLVLIHQGFVTPAEGGGTRHYEFAQHLAAQGARVSVVASDANYLSGQAAGATAEGGATDGGNLRICRVATVKTLHASVPGRLAAFGHFMVQSFRAAWRMGPCDVVMGTSPPIFQACSAWLLAALRRRPFLLEIRDLLSDSIVGIGAVKHRATIAFFRGLERFLYARADAILVNSPAYRDHLLALNVPAEKIELIPNGVDPRMFDPATPGDAARARFELGAAFVVAYTGAVGPANDLDTLLRAAARLRPHPDVLLVVAGGGKDCQRLQQEARDQGLDNLRFVGLLPKDQIKELLAAADACLAILKPLKIFTTNYPNKVFDYMAAGRPILLAIDGVIRKVVEEAGCGVFVTPGDDAALAQAILDLKAQPALRARMGRQGRDHVCRHFDRRDQARQFAGLLDRLAGTRTPPPEEPPA